MLNVHIIRHGQTGGNEERRYIGSTDEDLSSTGIALLEKNKAKEIYPACDAVYSSPMLRCLETADILYPGQARQIVPALAEYHFGIFEGKNYDELKGDPAYQAFIDSGGQSPIPGAPPLHEYQAACVAVFRGILEKAKKRVFSIAVICHGGAIMSILQDIRPLGDIYDYQVKNGDGFTIEWDQEKGSYGEIYRIRG